MAEKKKTEEPTIAEIVEMLRPHLEAKLDGALQRTADAEDRASEQEQAYWTKREELEEARTHLRSIREEYEALPMRSHTARMKGQEDHERELNERYRSLDVEVPQVEERIRSLTAELDHLAPGSRRLDPENGVKLHARTPLNRTAQAEREEIETLQEETLAPLYEEAQRIQQQVSGLSSRVEAAWRSNGYSNAAQVPSHSAEEG